MAHTPYVQNITDGLWYPITAVTVGAGVTLDVADTGGLATPPAYIPDDTDPLIDVASYMAIMGISDVANEAQWTFAALAVSDYVERWCHYSWRMESAAVPYGLQLIIARAISTLLGRLSPNTTEGVVSESFSSYSYSLAQGVSTSEALSPFYADLKMYRRVFLGM